MIQNFMTTSRRFEKNFLRKKDFQLAKKLPTSYGKTLAISQIISPIIFMPCFVVAILALQTRRLRPVAVR